MTLQSPETVDEIAVRMELVNACALAGGQTAFAQLHGFHPQYINNVVRGLKSPGVSIAGVLGYAKVTRYMRKSFASGAVPHRPGNSPVGNGAFHSS